jgi:hypothetical protein
VPVVLLRALAEQLPRVQATESLRRAAEVALGSGSLKREDALELHARWLEQAGAGRRRRELTRDERIAAAMNARLLVVRDGG